MTFVLLDRIEDPLWMKMIFSYYPLLILLAPLLAGLIIGLLAV